MKMFVAVSLLLCLCSQASAERQISVYLCSEERSVGWEKHQNGSYTLGKFIVDTKSFPVRYHSADLSGYKAGDIALPYLELSNPDGGSTRWASDRCYGNDLNLFASDKGTDSNWDPGCRASLEDQLSGNWSLETFGVGRWQFSKPLASRPSFVVYNSTIILPGESSYLSEGTCTLAN